MAVVCGWCEKPIHAKEPSNKIVTSRSSDPGGRTSGEFHVGSCTEGIEKRLGRDPG